jgi:hypothetical protein
MLLLIEQNVFFIISIDKISIMISKDNQFSY